MLLTWKSNDVYHADSCQPDISLILLTIQLNVLLLVDRFSLTVTLKF